MGRILSFLAILSLFGISINPVCAQNDPAAGGRFYGTTGDKVPYDTAAARDARERTLESAPLQEGPIDPTTYLMGPNDVLTVTIPVADYRQYDLQVYPDATVVIPRVGKINVRGRTLAEATALIQNAISRVFRTSDASVSLRKMRQFKVTLIGDVKKPGTVVATPATRVSEVIDLGGGVNPTASKRRVWVFRNGVRMPVDLLPYYALGDLASNPFVDGGDVIQVGVQDPADIIAIYGAVSRGGEYDFRPGDSISSLIRYAFGLTADAWRDSIELVRVNEHGDTLSRAFVYVEPDGSIHGDRPLRRGDRVFVRSITDYYRNSRVVVAGEVRRPGSYPLIPGVTRLRDVIDQAGGFNDRANLDDALLIRRQAIEDDRANDRKYASIYQIDPDKRTDEEIEYVRNKNVERQGVMTVDFAALMQGSERENIPLENKDSIVVPQRAAYVKVSGKVKNPGIVAYKPGATYEQYIAFAGGYGWHADEGDTRIIKQNSDTYPASSGSVYRIEPGDQIFVPEEKSGDFWAGFAQTVTIIAQIGTIVAVILSIRSVK